MEKADPWPGLDGQPGQSAPGFSQEIRLTSGFYIQVYIYVAHHMHTCIHIYT